MIYSLPDPINGGYRYLEAPGQTPINDDMPTPVFSVVTPLGVPSVHAGRPVPSRSKPVGSGSEAKGIIVTPTGRQASVSSMLPSGLGGWTDGPCPHWQRQTEQGQCVDRWWAGPPMGWMGSGLGYALGAALAGTFLYFVVRKES